VIKREREERVYRKREYQKRERKSTEREENVLIEIEKKQ
jgi:hypothetical protein